MFVTAYKYRAKKATRV